MKQDEFNHLVTTYSDIFDSSFQNKIDVYPTDVQPLENVWEEDYPYFDEVKFLR
jgi:hypothetical protein